MKAPKRPNEVWTYDFVEDRTLRGGRLREWLEKNGSKTLYNEPGVPWQNAYIESFNGKLRDECLNRHGAFRYLM